MENTSHPPAHRAEGSWISETRSYENWTFPSLFFPKRKMAFCGPCWRWQGRDGFIYVSSLIVSLRGQKHSSERISPKRISGIIANTSKSLIVHLIHRFSKDLQKKTDTTQHGYEIITFPNKHHYIGSIVHQWFLERSLWLFKVFLWFSKAKTHWDLLKYSDGLWDNKYMGLIH